MNCVANIQHPNIVGLVRDRVGASITGRALIESFDGLHPVEIKNALIAANELELLQLAFAELRVDAPVLHEVGREDNPVLSFWPFTDGTAERLARYLASFDTAALLGVPTVFGRLSSDVRSSVVLFDQDEYFFGREGTAGFNKCDLVSDIPKSYAGQFDLVLGDPPWYPDEYRAWLRTAITLAKPGGTIAFVLFPNGVRESGQRERRELLDLAAELLEDVSIDSKSVDYETPSFEQIQMLANGIKPVNWRHAHLFTAKVPLICKVENLNINHIHTDWIERRVGSGRLFVDARSVRNGSELLEFANCRSRFLSSPSVRDVGRQRANVLSSRGHGLICSDTEKFLRLLEGIKSLSDLPSCEMAMAPDSAKVFRQLVSDLWPRYIAVTGNEL